MAISVASRDMTAALKPIGAEVCADRTAVVYLWCIAFAFHAVNDQLRVRPVSPFHALPMAGATSEMRSYDLT